MSDVHHEFRRPKLSTSFRNSTTAEGARHLRVPPLPADALQHNDAPGLQITYAGDEFLLATKLIAQRRKDAADIVVLAKRLHLENPSAAELEQLIYRHYTDEDALELILDGNDTAREVHLLAVRAERLLASHNPEPTDAIRTNGNMTSVVRRENHSPSRERDQTDHSASTKCARRRSCEVACRAFEDAEEIQRFVSNSRSPMSGCQLVDTRLATREPVRVGRHGPGHSCGSIVELLDEGG